MRARRPRPTESLACVHSCREKIKSMKAAIDNDAPPKFKHMKRNLKKEQAEEGVWPPRCCVP